MVMESTLSQLCIVYGSMIDKVGVDVAPGISVTNSKEVSDFL